MPKDFAALAEHGKRYAGLTAEDEQLLLAMGPHIRPRLEEVTEAFYAELITIPEARPFLEGRIDSLKATHRAWLEEVFTGPYDAAFTERMHRVGEVHVAVKLPVELMACGITQVGNHLAPIVLAAHDDDALAHGRAMKAVNSILGFCLVIMQESYQSSLLAQELERFLSITGISRALFDNLAAAYRD